MRILIIVNSPKLNNSNKIDMYTGYGVYVNTIIDELEKEGHEIETLSFFSEYPFDINIKGLYEPLYLNSEDIADDLTNRIKEFDRVLVNGNIPLPIKFCMQDDTLNKATYVLHDPAHIDPMYGFENMKLRDRGDWNLDYLFSETRRLAIQDNYRNHIGQSFELDMAELRAYYDGQTQVYRYSDVVVPSKAYRELLRDLSGVSAAVIPHFLPIIGKPKQELRWPNNKVVSVAAWCKVDLINYIEQVKNNRDYHFTLFAGPQVQEVITPMFKWFGQLQNLEVRPLLPSAEFYDHLEHSDYSMCYHPTRIFETFGYVPYEMDHFGIRTQIMRGFSGILDCVNYTHTIVADQFSDSYEVKKSPLQELPSSTEYIKAIFKR